MQLSLFDHVCSAYAENDNMTNEALYNRVGVLAGISREAIDEQQPVGESGQKTSPIKREIRWHQQTLKQSGLIQRSGPSRWELTGKGRNQLSKARPGTTLVAFSTRLGVALWSLSEEVFPSLDAPITLCLTSPPYPLRNPRAYGNPDLSEYVEWVVSTIEPIARNLRDGGSICLNVTNDAFEPGTPARSLYRERLILEMAERLDLWKMDEIIWHNPQKPPTPTEWVSKTRQQLKAGYEAILWFTNNPQAVEADNRRVLDPHTDRMKTLIGKGGEARHRQSSDDAYRCRPGSFGNETPGRIPQNVLKMGHSCGSQNRYKKQAKALGLPPHGAPYPMRLALFLIRFLSRENDLVVDPFAGSQTTALAAEQTGRRWLTTDCMWEYARGGVERFRDNEHLQVSECFLSAVS